MIFDRFEKLHISRVNVLYGQKVIKVRKSDDMRNFFCMSKLI